MSIQKLQSDFLTSLSFLEERKEGKRRIDIEEDFIEETVKRIKKPLDKMLEKRKEAIILCEMGDGEHTEEELRAAVMARSRQDQKYWISNWCWIFNPWLTKYGLPPTLPFVLFPKQEEYIDWKEDLYQRNKSGLIYKCREVGLSWLNAANQTWHWFFEPGFQGRFGSLRVDEVDDRNNPDSIFWKIRFMIYHTPQWMRPTGYKTQTNKHDNLLKIFNPDNTATIAGDGGDNMGRGGRAAMYDCDEWASVLHDRAVKANLSANCRCIFYTSTPKGMDNDFAAMYHEGKIPIFSIDWWDDPRKSKDWLANFEEEFDEAIVAQEVHKRFDAYKEGTAIPIDWVNASISLWNKIENGEIEYQSDDRACGLDVAAGGRNRSVFIGREGIVVKVVKEWNIDNTTMLSEKAGTETEIFGGHTLNYDPIAVGVGVRSAYELTDYDFTPMPIDARSAASEIPLEGDDTPARERCLNRRAEIVVRVRRKFEKTYEFIAKDINHPIDDMIAIPPNPSKLRSQLSVPELLRSSGKWQLESKDRMVKRGVESPDYFDATMFAFADEVRETHVLKSFKYTKEDRIIHWQDVNPKKGALHYVSIQHDKNLKAGILGAVWWAHGRKLQIYDEYLTDNPTPQEIVNQLRIKFPHPVYQYIGNKEIFGKADDDSLFMNYMEYNVMIEENFMYNELSAISQIDQMFEYNQIDVDKKCRNLVSQLATWDRNRGVPDKTNATLAYALCNMINHLQDQGVFVEPKAKVHRGYRPEAIEKKKSWQSR